MSRRTLTFGLFVLVSLLLLGVAAGTGARAEACPDADQDGYADCDPPGCDPTGLPCGDCDDADFERHPGAAEWCDHVDQNCDGRADEGYDRPLSSIAVRDPAGREFETLGGAVAVLGDVTGDGIADFVAGAINVSTGELIQHGAVVVFSGADRSVVCRALDPDAQDRDLLGRSVAAVGDVTGDGTPDFAAGADGDDVGSAVDAGSVLLFSGADCAFVRKLTDPDGSAEEFLGLAVAGVDDLNGDGLPDVLAGASYDETVRGERAGSVAVFSSSDGAVIFRLVDPEGSAFDYLGRSVAAPGDLNGDGVPDVAAGAYLDAAGAPGSGSVVTFSGADGARLHKLVDPDADAADGLGFSLAGIGDVDGDGVPDLAAGAPFDDVDGAEDAGSVVLFSGATGVAIRKLTDSPGATGAFLGRAVAGAGDVDGDGVPDVLAGADGADDGARLDTGALLLFSGADGSVLQRFSDPNGADLHHLGRAVAPSVDLSGDGEVDFLAGAPLAGHDGKTSTGQVVVFSLESDCDGDGFSPIGGDCNDGDSATRPGALEECDDEDDDCDGVVDNGCPAVCGNGRPEPPEECDESVKTASCDADCTTPLCGDGDRNALAGEECDDGNTVSGDGCWGGCLTEAANPNLLENGGFDSGDLPPWAWYTNATGSARIVNGAARVETTTIGSNMQLLQQDLELTGGIAYRLTFDARCVNGGRACGASASDAELSVELLQQVTPYASYGLGWPVPLTATLRSYAVEFITPLGIGAVRDGRLRFRLSGFAEAGDVYTFDDVHLEKLTACGDGILDANESCDDGNTTAGDGCDPGACVPGGCGNGVIAAEEECDDANGESGDGCSASCTTEAFNPNRLVNGSFETGSLQPWQWHTDATGQAGVVDGAVQCRTESVAGETWLAQSSVPLLGGAAYRIAFDASCSHAGRECGLSPEDPDLRVVLHETGAPDVAYGLVWPLALTPWMRTHATVFSTPPELGGGADGVLRLDLGEGLARPANVYTFDDLYLEKLPVCGDGWIDPDESCDDGNLLGGDGCEPDCGLTCVDLDGDGYGAPGHPFCNAGADEDCDDAQADTYPRAPEVNDGDDNQCPGDAGFGISDETSGTSTFSDKSRYGWPAQDGAAQYEVLRSSRRDLHAGCLFLVTEVNFVEDPELPGPDAVFHYLNRALAPWPGSWGADSAGLPRVACGR